MNRKNRDSSGSLQTSRRSKTPDSFGHQVDRHEQERGERCRRRDILRLPAGPRAWPHLLLTPQHGQQQASADAGKGSPPSARQTDDQNDSPHHAREQERVLHPERRRVVGGDVVERQKYENDRAERQQTVEKSASARASCATSFRICASATAASTTLTTDGIGVTDIRHLINLSRCVVRANIRRYSLNDRPDGLPVQARRYQSVRPFGPARRRAAPSQETQCDKTSRGARQPDNPRAGEREEERRASDDRTVSACERTDTRRVRARR